MSESFYQADFLIFAVIKAIQSVMSEYQQLATGEYILPPQKYSCLPCLNMPGDTTLKRPSASSFLEDVPEEQREVKKRKLNVQPDADGFIDLGPYVGMTQIAAAKAIGMPTSTLSKVLPLVCHS